MVAGVNAEAKVGSLHVIVLENDWLRVSILPEVGAKIYDFVWKPTGRNFLWHNPRIRPQPYPIEANFDNYWCGGWDEGFPTCEACEYRGENYPNLGELRSLRWTVESATGRKNEDAVVKLSAFGPISPVRAEKTVTLRASSPVVEVHHEITNLGPLPLDFIWGTHPALDPTSHMVLRIPAKTGIVGQSSVASLGKPGQRYTWPKLETAAGRTDMSLVQGKDAKIFAGHYVTDFEAGWYAVEDAETGDGFLLKFPEKVCRYLWLWLVYGGWRGYHHVIVEPWTSYPVTLSEAVRQGTHRQLEPQQKFSVEVCATIYTRPDTWQDALKQVK